MYQFVGDARRTWHVDLDDESPEALLEGVGRLRSGEWPRYTHGLVRPANRVVLAANVHRGRRWQHADKVRFIAIEPDGVPRLELIRKAGQPGERVEPAGSVVVAEFEAALRVYQRGGWDFGFPPFFFWPYVRQGVGAR